MTTANKIAEIVKSAAAVTLYGGYAVGYDGKRQTFEACKVVKESRNKAGRCTKLVAQYKDGSELTFTYSESRGHSYKVTK